jgi:hypothetical protein
MEAKKLTPKKQIQKEKKKIGKLKRNQKKKWPTSPFK